MNQKALKPIIGITMGDAAGIGPEIILKTLSCSWVFEECLPVIIGSEQILCATKNTCQNITLTINPINDISEAKFKPGQIDCININNLNVTDIAIGQVNEIAGQSSMKYIEKAVDMAMKRQISAIVTAPICKEAINKAGWTYQGHTDFLASLTKTRQYTMMFVSDWLKLALVTIHVPLKKVPHLISKQKVFSTINLLHNTLLEDFGIESPRIGVAGLNPHAGEQGILGKEEKTIIIPAIEEAIQKGIHAMGPYPPDTLFYHAYQGKIRNPVFDGIVAIYHDQGLIPLKMLSFDTAVNITCGLPIIRTSPDHGTAFDIAGKDMANPQSMIEAIRLAIMIARKRR